MLVRFHWILLFWLVLANFRFNQARHATDIEGTDEQYFHLDSQSDTYNYGYEVHPDGNFHHERRGPERVTYGCYGYIDSKQKLHVTHYVSDRKGYRVVEPNKPIVIYLSDKIAWKAFLLPKGCGRTDKPSSTGPELIYKPKGSVSTPSKPATATTRRTTTTSAPPTKPSVAQSITSTAATCSCVCPSTTKPTVLTPKPPTTTTVRSTTDSKSTSTTTARTTPVSTTKPSTSTTPKPALTTKKPDHPIIDIDVDVSIGRPSHYIYRPDEADLNLERGSRAQNSSSPQIYYVPYHRSSAPPGVPSTSHGHCSSGFGYIGLAPVIFVPISAAKNLGLARNDPKRGRDDIPLRMFTKPGDGGNWAVKEVPDDDGNHIGLVYSKELEKIVNGVDIGLLMRSDSFK